MTSAPVHYKRPTPLQAALILANPWTPMFAGMVLTVWAGGKACSVVEESWSIIRGGADNQLRSSASIGTISAPVRSGKAPGGP